MTCDPGDSNAMISLVEEYQARVEAGADPTLVWSDILYKARKAAQEYSRETTTEDGADESFTAEAK